jgi:anti-sigma regulatory factor (Ser/Thr protein kinase)
VPYVICSACGVRTYAASRQFTSERCPNCGAELRDAPAVNGPGLRRPILTRRFPPNVDSVPLARKALDAIAGPLGEEGLDVARLLVSELVANAVVHASLDHGEPVGLAVYLSSDAVRVEVHDSGPGFDTELAERELMDPSGRGLMLVAKMATRWGVEPGAGATVWFELPRNGVQTA